MENIYHPYGGDMKLSLQTIKKHWDISDDFPVEVEVLMKHYSIPRSYIEIMEDCSCYYVVVVKGEYWGFIEDVEYLMGADNEH